MTDEHNTEQTGAPETAQQTIDQASLVDEIRRQVMQELKSEAERERLERMEARKEAEEAHKAYIAKMMDSPDPWVEIIGWVETTDGVKVELEWNDAFVIYLKEQGITGADDDQIVQKWVALLMENMTAQMQDDAPEDSQYS